MITNTEENYLKALFSLTFEKGSELVGTNELATYLLVKPATVSDMLKKLKEKSLVEYEKYGKITLTEAGRKLGIGVLRKNRLWETFLYEKLDFTWDEVQEVAEHLEHIPSFKLIEKLDKFLDYPTFDPHGNPIPNSAGEISIQYKKTLSEIEVGHSCKMVAIKESSNSFLQYVMNVGLVLNNNITILQKKEYDQLIDIEVNGKISTVSQKFAENIFVICSHCKVGGACAKAMCEIAI
jgi:DtxR family transcriptional regulator, Mn-dependent transcriptional regulator